MKKGFWGKVSNSFLITHFKKFVSFAGMGEQLK